MPTPHSQAPLVCDGPSQTGITLTGAGGWIKRTVMGPPNKVESRLRVWDERRQPFVTPSSTEVAEKQLTSSSAPKWVVFKTLHADRAIPQLLCAERGRGWAHMHVFLGRVSVCSRYLSPSSLPTQLLGGMGGRVMARAGVQRLSRVVMAQQGGDGQAGTWRPRHNVATSCPRGRQEARARRGGGRAGG